MTNKVHFDIATPYTAIYLIFEHEGKIAFLLREHTSWMSGHYSLPAGRVEHGESYMQAAIREAKEEVGVSIKPKDLQHLLTAHRSKPDSLWVDVVFRVRQWQGELHNAEPHIHGELRWYSLDEVPKNIVPDVLFYLQEIASGKSYTEYGWNT